MELWQRLMATVLGIIHVCFAFAILFGGVIRFPPPTYEPLLRFSDGHIWPYGVAYFIAGLLMLIRTKKCVMVGLGVGALINDLWAALFLIAIFENPNAGATATIAYGGYAQIDMILLALLVWGDGTKFRKGG